MVVEIMIVRSETIENFSCLSVHCDVTAGEVMQRERMTDTSNPNMSYKLRRFKEFKPQESLFRTLFLTCREFQTLFAVILALVHACLVFQVIGYFIDHKTFWDDVNFAHWSFVETFTPFLVAWIQIFSLSLLFHPLVLFWKNGFLPRPLFMLILAGYFVVTTFITKTLHLSNTYMAAIACEHTRMMMKVLAFVIAQNKKTESDPKTSFTHFLYFFFAPTLVFRESYPRNNAVNWKRVFALSYFFLLHVYSLMVLCRHWVAPFYRYVGLRPLDLKEVISFQRSAYAMYFVIHIGGIACALIHCWMNIFAEVLTFADRNFYQNWWSVDNPLEQLRKWNSVVGDWIYEYVYADIVYITGGNKPLSTISVFLLSAVMHDYVLNMLFGTRFVPVMTITYGALGSGVVMFLVLYRKFRWDRFAGGYLLSNAACHFATGLSYMIWINFYAIEYYCRKNVPRKETSFLDAVTPHSLSCLRFE